MFVFEGPDGVGKSTIIQETKKKLVDDGFDVLNLSFPGKTQGTLGKLVYDIHHNKQGFSLNDSPSSSLQVLHVAAHIDCIENIIKPALNNGKIILLDRFWWSTVVYSLINFIPKVVLDSMITIENQHWGNIKPNALFLIDRESSFREEFSFNKWSRLKNEYIKLADKESENYEILVIHNSRSVSCVVNNILISIHKKLETKNYSIKTVKEKQRKKKDIQKHITRDPWYPAKITPVYDTYWKFAAKRQEIFFQRIINNNPPYADDPILKEYKFTNAYRASDRVSQYLIKNVIYEGDQSPEELFFRIILFKTFNKIQTWEMLSQEIDCIKWEEYKYSRYEKILSNAVKSKQSIYSAAYIMPSGGKCFGHNLKYRNHLQLIELMMKDNVPARICGSKNLQNIFLLLRSYPMIGDFLAFQYTIDLNYSAMIDFPESSFVVPGPGARNGIHKCFSDLGGLSEVDIIKLMTNKQNYEFERLGIDFKDLWGRSLQLIDCQNLFCEVDKYARIAHPDIKGLTGRSRIKQKFRSNNYEPIQYFYPPKWNINKAIHDYLIKASYNVSEKGSNNVNSI